jgi:hypothetical protein
MATLPVLQGILQGHEVSYAVDGVAQYLVQSLQLEFTRVDPVGCDARLSVEMLLLRDNTSGRIFDVVGAMRDQRDRAHVVSFAGRRSTIIGRVSSAAVFVQAAKHVVMRYTVDGLLFEHDVDPESV